MGNFKAHIVKARHSSELGIVLCSYTHRPIYIDLGSIDFVDTHHGKMTNKQLLKLPAEYILLLQDILVHLFRPIKGIFPSDPNRSTFFHTC